VDAMSDRMAATAFVERLLRLSLAAWHQAALGSPAALDVITERTFREVLQAPEVAWDAWCVRDDVEATFWRFDCAEGRELLRPHGRRSHVRAVSDRAALAVLVHDLISLPDFDRCYGEFQSCIRVSDIHINKYLYKCGYGMP
jgi:hypothetical protein